MKYKLIASDMDGTLLNDDSQLTPRTKTAILKAIDAGVLFIAATGRPLMRVVDFLSLFDNDMPCIIFNGATAFMSKSGKVLFHNYLDVSLAREAFSIGVSRNIPMILWTDNRLWTNRVCENTSEYANLSGSDMTVIKNLDALEGRSISKVLWIDTEENTLLQQRVMKEHFGDRLNCHRSLPRYLEFVSPRATKGGAMAEIGKIYGIGRDEMIGIGDSFNDISMIEYAGLGVAVANAPDDIKAISNHITLSNNEDGVAAVIEKYILCPRKSEPR